MPEPIIILSPRTETPTVNKPRYLLKETDFSLPEIAQLFALAADFKLNRGGGTPGLLARQTWGLLFFKNSTRTRVSFEVGIHELGGHALYMDTQNMQLSRGESIEDTARVLSRYVHGMVIRAFEHRWVEEFSNAGCIPVINALTDSFHPCQSYTDAFSIAERIDPKVPSPLLLKGRKLAYLGDCASNMAQSWILLGAHLGMEVVLAGPQRYAPDDGIMDVIRDSGLVPTHRFTEDAGDAARGADVVYTDVWVSMGDEAEAEDRLKSMAPYTVDSKLMSHASPDAVFMHCLPAHPGQEVSQEVLDSPQSIVFDQAENRLHVQKAILAILGLSHSEKDI